MRRASEPAGGRRSRSGQSTHSARRTERVRGLWPAWRRTTSRPRCGAARECFPRAAASHCCPKASRRGTSSSECLLLKLCRPSALGLAGSTCVAAALHQPKRPARVASGCHFPRTRLVVARARTNSVWLSRPSTAVGGAAPALQEDRRSADYRTAPPPPTEPTAPKPQGSCPSVP